MVRQGLEPAVLICRIAINEDGRGRLGQEILNDADIGFTVDVLEDQREVAPRGDFGITQHVPERSPGDGSREWIGEFGEVLRRRRQRALVQPNLGVGQVQVVDEQQVGEGLAIEVFDRGVFAGNVELDATSQQEGTGFTVVQSHGQPVRPDGRELRWRLLLDREGAERLARGRGQRPQRIEAGRLQPELGPGLEVAPGSRFDVGQEVGEAGVRILPLLDVALDAAKEGVLRHVGNQLTQNAGSLVVGDRIEVQVDGLNVGDIGRDRVGGGSWRRAPALYWLAKVTQPFLKRVASTWASTDMKVAKLSFSQRSSHQRMVTRSPNHMWAISWRMALARSSRTASVTLERNSIDSLKVTQPMFSMAPALNSGTKS